MRRALTAALVFTVALLAVACGESTVDTSAAEETVTRLIAEETGFTADDMSCPEDVPAEVDEEFQCEFTGPEGPYVADVTITEVDGEDAVFAVESRRAD